MKLKVFTLQFDAASGAFPDDVLREFSDRNEILSVTEQFFQHLGLPYWAILLTYREKISSSGASLDDDRRIDWRNRLGDEEKACFDALRKWRSQRARDEGIPPYLICTNRQAAQIVASRPSTLTMLGEIPGIGDAKIEKYGQAILEIIGSMTLRDKTSQA